MKQGIAFIFVVPALLLTMGASPLHSSERASDPIYDDSWEHREICVRNCQSFLDNTAVRPGAGYARCLMKCEREFWKRTERE